MSALATIVGSLGELSESELRQLYLMVGVRLGIPDVPAGAKPQGQGGGKSTARKSPSSGKSGKKGASSKGNPQRKSQWANHPLYQEYARLKKAVETQAKESNLSFNMVNTAESRAYQLAFSRWLEAKSSFRGHGESGQDRVKPGEKKNDSEDESGAEEEEEDEPQGSSSRAPPPPTPGSGKPASPPAKPNGTTGKPSVSPPKGKAPAK